MWVRLAAMESPTEASVRAYEVAERIAEHLSSHTYLWSDERELQDAVARRLAERFVFSQEKAISRSERPDFLVVDGGVRVAVEIKVAGSRAAVLRQLGRYAADTAVDAVVLASGRRTLLAGTVEVLHRKPVCVALLGGLI